MEIFFHHKASPFVRKIFLALSELGIAPVERPVDISSGAAMEEYGQLNPNRRFPALRDGSLVLWESNAILRYLATQHGPCWLGTTTAEVAQVDQWLCWELAHLGPALFGVQNLRLGFLPRPPRDEAALLADSDRLLTLLDRALNGRVHLVGEAMTIADLAVAATFTFAEEAELLTPSHPHVCRWLDSIRMRPSWQATERMKRETLASFGITLPQGRGPSSAAPSR